MKGLSRAIPRPSAVITLAGASLGLGLLATIGAQAEQTDCSRAWTPADFTICNSERLIVLEERVTDAHLGELAFASDWRKAQNIHTEQADWRRHVEACRDDALCLEMQHRMRLHDHAMREAPAPEPLATIRLALSDPWGGIRRYTP